MGGGVHLNFAHFAVLIYGTIISNPVTAIFLRTLAWELYVAKEKLAVQDVVKEKGLVQSARKELGLLPLQGGAAHDFIQKLRLGPTPLLSPSQTPPKPVEQGWTASAAWRHLYLPPHNIVRQLSAKPVYSSVSSVAQPSTHTEFKVTLRDPALPILNVFVGAQSPPNNTQGPYRGLYFLRLKDSLYVGKSDEFHVRLTGHKGKMPLWWVFVSPEHSVQTFPKDALDAAESLLISFWNETSMMENGTRGGDQRPAFTYLQQAVLMVEAASAVLLWLIREKGDLGLPDWSIPFKSWQSQNWPSCYMKVPE